MHAKNTHIPSKYLFISIKNQKRGGRRKSFRSNAGCLENLRAAEFNFVGFDGFQIFPIYVPWYLICDPPAQNQA
jgi:hypothetical protein